MAGAKQGDDKKPNIKILSRNRKASFEYELFERVECGIILLGTEVKSLRDGNGRIDEAYARCDDGEVWLLGAEIAEYKLGTHANHKPKRPRQLLLHKREIAKLATKMKQSGFTLVPTQLYFKNGKAKLEIALAKGKKLYDKRESLKKADAKREMDRARK